MTRILSWFSCGAASAAAAKMAIEKYGSDCQVVYCDTMEAEHPDNARFFSEVESWLGVKITTIKSSVYSSVDDVFQKRKYMVGIAGAPCTVQMKKTPREAFQEDTDTHVFGYTVEEKRRASIFEKNNPTLAVEWVLIDSGVTKQDCLAMLSSAGIKLPEMYALGFDHNNCLGCVKATSPGYWNKIRRLFPETFEKRARQSRIIGSKLVRVKGERIYLDMLPPDEFEPDDDIDCGPVCVSPPREPQ